MKIGLKLWSTNQQWFAEAVSLFRQKHFDFIELYIVPGSFQPEKFSLLKEAKIPINIHAPNEHQLNLMETRTENDTILEEVFRFADFFESEYIIVHSGLGTEKEKLLGNLQKNCDPRLVIENVPCKAIRNHALLYGYNYEMLKEIMDHFSVGFCLDFTHAVKAAKTQGVNPQEFIEKLASLNPKVFHLSDTDKEVEHDQHFNLGEGNMDLKFNQEIVKKFPAAFVVFETPKGSTLENDLKNIKFFREL